MLMTEESELLAMEITGADSMICLFFSHRFSSVCCSITSTLLMFIFFCSAFHWAMFPCPRLSISLHSCVSFSFIMDSIARGLINWRNERSSP